MANPLYYTEVKKIGDATIYQVVDVQSSDVQFAKPVESVLTFGDDISIELMKNLAAGNTITIPIADVEGGVTIEDFTIVEPDTLVKYKNMKKGKIQNIFTFYLASIGGLTFFKVIHAFSILASKGYFITDENREDKYLEIINTGDAELIATLEEYLDAYDKIGPIASMHDTMKQASIDIDEATDEGGVDSAVHMFETVI